ncbi:uncharacterized protein KY384_006805 [Bacidia gigantensis]|uniref:uncharacterized protein n=1 Tax=Bacidia gigantensis TaxID=2732470 RepID=UPI001D042B21|nr:uncharacterized protein KY384_006805 [Bacidia gigantensis]KAG8527889.1 hypothetical protein KY384_006805 [Bacidia gigantensis]
MPFTTYSSGAAPTADDWEARRAQITHLYCEEDNTLAEVMTIVNKPEFRASAKMYKSRISKWGLGKNHKEYEARAIIHAYAQDRKPSRLRLRGQIVDINGVLQYFKRKGISIHDVLNTDAKPLPGLVIETPAIKLCSNEDSNARAFLDSAIQAGPSRIEPPDSLKTAEGLFADIHEYAKAFFGTGSPFFNGREAYSLTFLGLDYEGMDMLSHFLRNHNLSEWYNQSSQYIERFVERQPLLALPAILEVILEMQMKDHKLLARSSFMQLCAMSTNLGPREGPVWRCRQKVVTRMSVLINKDEMKDCVTQLLQCLVDSHRKTLGGFHMHTIAATSSLTRVMAKLYGPEQVLRSLQVLHTALEGQQPPSRSKRSGFCAT